MNVSRFVRGLRRCLALVLMGLAPATQAQALERPTIVLVHGAFAESASWDGVIERLTERGYYVIALANPLRGVSRDAAYLGALLSTIAGPVVLVGHSYGGMVISAPAARSGNVQALVFVAAFLPDTNETAIELTGRFPGSSLSGTLAPPVPMPNGEQDLYIDQTRFRAQFAADVPVAIAARMAAAQRPIAQSALGEPAGVPGWRTIPSWSIYGTADLNIPAAAHSFMAERAGVRRKVPIPGASHVVMVSHPAEVAGLIEQAAIAR